MHSLEHCGRALADTPPHSRLPAATPTRRLTRDCPLLPLTLQVRHCALSLVGEPIMYPHINKLVSELHKRRISTFLVTNAQFPECISALEPVTQLYVSIDAATKETLKAIDRPLFADFWERFLGACHSDRRSRRRSVCGACATGRDASRCTPAASLDELRAKRQRTVYRLTLLKGHNMTELDAYVELIARGQPDFIEVRVCAVACVLACVRSRVSAETAAAPAACHRARSPHAAPPRVAGEGRHVLRHQPRLAPHHEGVPWHTEVKEFCETLAGKLGGGYGLAVEHEHSCFVLLAKTAFHIGGVWHTHIDYDRFHELVAAYHASGGTARFTSADYMAPTPAWAVYDAAERGFDPREARWRRTREGGVAELDYKASESGCG